MQKKKIHKIFFFHSILKFGETKNPDRTRKLSGLGDWLGVFDLN